MKQAFSYSHPFLIAVFVLLSSCATTPYNPSPLSVDSLRQRAEVQTFEPLTVKAAVPGADESKSLFGVPLYDHEVQPVWLEITNQSDERVRLALSSVDPDYFSPLEVAYTLKNGFSKTARAAMDKRFHESGITRFVDPGETISGFIFTHLSPGTKSFNVDLFSATTTQNFAFFVRVPGLVPDHATVDFQNLYTQDEIRYLTTDELRGSLNDLAHYTTDADAQSNGLPINAVIIGKGNDVLRALLRAGWYESTTGSSGSSETRQSSYFLFGRKPDGVFRLQRKNSVDRNELRLWVAPMWVDGENVWLAQVTNFVGQRSYIEKVFFGAHLDPDIDGARSFLLQNIWYSQGLQAFAWSKAGSPVAVDQPRTDFNGNLFYTDGYRTVMWFSGIPCSLLDTSFLKWDEEQE